MDALREEGRIVRTEPYTHNVPFSHRSGERIEPLISLQWFMRMDELAAPALDVVRDGRVRIRPEGQRRRYFECQMENIRPWCVSRRLWWGHRIPVWYRGEETYCGIEPPEGDGWEQDPDVLDTWFSSGLWPFATLGWPDDTPELRAFYPTDVLSTARDIIFLWVARMIMFGLEFAGDIPFSDVNVHPIIQAPDGRRMSKSLGTGIDPIDLIDGGRAPPSSSRAATSPPTARTLRFELLAMALAGRALQRGQGRAGPPAHQQALERASRLLLLRVGRAVERARSPSRTRGSCRGCSAPRRPPRPRSRTSSSTAQPLGLYDFVYGDLRLVPRADQSPGSTRTTTPRSPRSRCTSCARRSRSPTR